MKWTRSAVITTIAELPVKLVRYRMLGSDVTTSASRSRTAIAVRIASCRRSSALLDAKAMGGVEESLERPDGQQSPFAKGIGFRRGRRFLATSVPDNRDRRRTGDRPHDLRRRRLGGHDPRGRRLRRSGRRRDSELPRQVLDRALQLWIVSGERQ